MRSKLNWMNIFSPQYWQVRYIAFIPAVFSVLLLLGVAHSLAKVTWAMWPAPEAIQALPVTTGSVNDAAKQPPAADNEVKIASIAEWHLFGQFKPAPKLVAKPQPVIVPETKLNLVLSGITASNDKKNARAIIADPTGKQDYYAHGAKVPGGAVLKEIYPDRIILTLNNKAEVLRLLKEDSRSRAAISLGNGEEEAPLPTALPAPDAIDPDALAAEEFQAQGGFSQKELGEELQHYQEALTTNPSSLIGLANAEPVNEGGELSGFRLQPGNDPALFERFGLEPGDVVTSINGISVGDVAKRSHLMQTLSTANKLQVVIERGGESQTLGFDIGQ